MDKHINSTAEIIARALGGHKSGNGWMARCPCHDDSKASLSVRDGDHGVLVTCHAGCDRQDVISKLKDRGLWQTHATCGRSTIIKTYDYTDEDGTLLFQVCRFEPKTFRQRRKAQASDDPDKIKDGWVWSVKGVKQVPYRPPDLAEAIANEHVVFIVEGEKDVDNLAELGIPATCNAGGACKWRHEQMFQHFYEADVVIIPDNDEPGRDHANLVATSLETISSEAGTHS
jgi:putative DNA primase/helicase